MDNNEKFEIDSVPFPPQITIQEVIPAVSGNLNPKIQNSFLIYRKELVNIIKSKNITLDWPKVSTLASKLWAREPDYVKAYYKEMSTQAQLQFNLTRGALFSQNFDNTLQDTSSSLQRQRGTSSSASFPMASSNSRSFDFNMIPMQDTSSSLQRQHGTSSSASFSVANSNSRSFDLNMIPIQDTSSSLQRQHGTSSSASFPAVASSSSGSFDASEANFFGNNPLTYSPSLQGNQSMNFTGNVCASPVAMTSHLQQATAFDQLNIWSPLQNPHPNFVTSEARSQLNNSNEERIRIQKLEQLVQNLTHRVQVLEQLLINAQFP